MVIIGPRRFSSVSGTAAALAAAARSAKSEWMSLNAENPVINPAATATHPKTAMTSRMARILFVWLSVHVTNKRTLTEFGSKTQSATTAEAGTRANQAAEMTPIGVKMSPTGDR